MGLEPGIDDGGGDVGAVWIDAQLPPALALWIREAYGVAAAHVIDLDLADASDRRIFEAASGTGSVIVTKDADFVILLRQWGPPPQVVWLRLGNSTNRELRRVVLEAWPRAADLLGRGEPLVEIRRRADPSR